MPGVTAAAGAADDALAPVRAALIGEASRQAGEIRAAARAEADAMVTDARRQAAEILAEARSRGELDGRSAAEERRTAARRAARATVLAAQRAAYDELRRRVRDAVIALRTDPVYPCLLGQLGRLARGLAGPSATITRHAGGGVVAQGPGRYVDCSLPRIADRAVDGLGAEVTQLWAA